MAAAHACLAFICVCVILSSTFATNNFGDDIVEFPLLVDAEVSSVPRQIQATQGTDVAQYADYADKATLVKCMFLETPLTLQCQWRGGICPSPEDAEREVQCSSWLRASRGTTSSEAESLMGSGSKCSWQMGGACLLHVQLAQDSTLVAYDSITHGASRVVVQPPGNATVPEVTISNSSAPACSDTVLFIPFDAPFDRAARLYHITSHRGDSAQVAAFGDTLLLPRLVLGELGTTRLYINMTTFAGVTQLPSVAVDVLQATVTLPQLLSGTCLPSSSGAITIRAAVNQAQCISASSASEREFSVQFSVDHTDGSAALPPAQFDALGAFAIVVQAASVARGWGAYRVTARLLEAGVELHAVSYEACFSAPDLVLSLQPKWPQLSRASEVSLAALATGGAATLGGSFIAVDTYTWTCLAVAVDGTEQPLEDCSRATGASLQLLAGSLPPEATLLHVHAALQRETAHNDRPGAVVKMEHTSTSNVFRLVDNADPVQLTVESPQEMPGLAPAGTLRLAAVDRLHLKASSNRDTSACKWSVVSTSLAACSEFIGDSSGPDVNVNGECLQRKVAAAGSTADALLTVQCNGEQRTFMLSLEASVSPGVLLLAPATGDAAATPFAVRWGGWQSAGGALTYSLYVDTTGSADAAQVARGGVQPGVLLLAAGLEQPLVVGLTLPPPALGSRLRLIAVGANALGGVATAEATVQVEMPSTAAAAAAATGTAARVGGLVAVGQCAGATWQLLAATSAVIASGGLSSALSSILLQAALRIEAGHDVPGADGAASPAGAALAGMLAPAAGGGGLDTAGRDALGELAWRTASRLLRQGGAMPPAAASHLLAAAAAAGGGSNSTGTTPSRALAAGGGTQTAYCNRGVQRLQNTTAAVAQAVLRGLVPGEEGGVGAGAPAQGGITLHTAWASVTSSLTLHSSSAPHWTAELPPGSAAAVTAANASMLCQALSGSPAGAQSGINGSSILVHSDTRALQVAAPAGLPPAALQLQWRGDFLADSNATAKGEWHTVTCPGNGTAAASVACGTSPPLQPPCGTEDGGRRLRLRCPFARAQTLCLAMEGGGWAHSPCNTTHVSPTHVICTCSSDAFVAPGVLYSVVAPEIVFLENTAPPQGTGVPILTDTPPGGSPILLASAGAIVLLTALLVLCTAALDWGSSATYTLALLLTPEVVLLKQLAAASKRRFRVAHHLPPRVEGAAVRQGTATNTADLLPAAALAPLFRCCLEHLHCCVYGAPENPLPPAAAQAWDAPPPKGASAGKLRRGSSLRTTFNPLHPRTPMRRRTASPASSVALAGWEEAPEKEACGYRAPPALRAAVLTAHHGLVFSDTLLRGVRLQEHMLLHCSIEDALLTQQVHQAQVQALVLPPCAGLSRCVLQHDLLGIVFNFDPQRPRTVRLVHVAWVWLLMLWSAHHIMDITLGGGGVSWRQLAATAAALLAALQLFAGGAWWVLSSTIVLCTAQKSDTLTSEARRMQGWETLQAGWRAHIGGGQRRREAPPTHSSRHLGATRLRMDSSARTLLSTAASRQSRKWTVPAVSLPGRARCEVTCCHTLLLSVACAPTCRKHASPSATPGNVQGLQVTDDADAIAYGWVPVSHCMQRWCGLCLRCVGRHPSHRPAWLRLRREADGAPYGCCWLGGVHLPRNVPVDVPSNLAQHIAAQGGKAVLCAADAALARRLQARLVGRLLQAQGRRTRGGCARAGARIAANLPVTCAVARRPIMGASTPMTAVAKRRIAAALARSTELELRPASPCLSSTASGVLGAVLFTACAAAALGQFRDTLRQLSDAQQLRAAAAVAAVLSLHYCVLQPLALLVTPQCVAWVLQPLLALPVSGNILWTLAREAGYALAPLSGHLRHVVRREAQAAACGVSPFEAAVALFTPLHLAVLGMSTHQEHRQHARIMGAGKVAVRTPQLSPLHQVAAAPPELHHPPPSQPTPRAFQRKPSASRQFGTVLARHSNRRNSAQVGAPTGWKPSAAATPPPAATAAAASPPSPQPKPKSQRPELLGRQAHMSMAQAAARGYLVSRFGQTALDALATKHATAVRCDTAAGRHQLYFGGGGAKAGPPRTRPSLKAVARSIMAVGAAAKGHRGQALTKVSSPLPTARKAHPQATGAQGAYDLRRTRELQAHAARLRPQHTAIAEHTQKKEQPPPRI